MYRSGLVLQGFCRQLLCIAAWEELQLPVTILVDKYKVAKMRLQSMLCESKDAVIQKNVLDRKTVL